ncbi:MAG: SUMF1/EgtB/PvdO family nonheme iron enzyme [Magnetococcales bacterium]|nr:SUMF1/EgtB/PvdO family nonheme iron enzyme [Magnetococcales bacterium]
MSSNKIPDALPDGSKLLWFETLKVLGKGGFGITYLGQDTKQGKLVAIKEYLPTAYASRNEFMEVRAKSPEDQETFEWGLERFLKEAQILARFKHPAIVRVVSFFRDSSTAYMVMEYIEGDGLDVILKKRKTLEEEYLIQILPPLLNGLQLLHKAKFIHRDLKPANILIRGDGTPVLLDFGSARQSVVGKETEMTSLLSLGYSPFEQYDTTGDRQGPWSDIYAMSGVLYRAISGKRPPDASQRIAARLRGAEDPMRTAVYMGGDRYKKSFLAAIDHGLMVLETDRPQSVKEWRVELLGPDKDNTGQEGIRGKAEGRTRLKKRKKSSWRSFIASISELGEDLFDDEDMTLVTRKDIIVPVRSEVLRKPLPKDEDTKIAASPSSKASSQPTRVSEDVTPQQAEMVEDDDTFVTIKNETQKPSKIFIEPITKVEFIWVSDGLFLMGSRENEPGHCVDEAPIHEVHLKGFWLSKYPITWEVWRQLMGNYPSGLYDESKKNHPVERIGFNDIKTFLSRFSNLGDGKNSYRLPTEAEWEYVVRAGSQTLFPFRGGAKILTDHAWYRSNSEKSTQPVGQKLANAWGFHDMLGNVWEWVDDWYSADFYQNSPAKNPKSPKVATSKKRSVRGGSWASPPKECRSANRQPVSTKISNNMIGFRVVCLKKG